MFNTYPAYSARHPFDVQLDLAMDINGISFGGGPNKYKQDSGLARAAHHHTVLRAAGELASGHENSGSMLPTSSRVAS